MVAECDILELSPLPHVKYTYCERALNIDPVAKFCFPNSVVA